MRGAGISGPGSFSVLGPAVPVSSGSIVAPDVCVWVVSAFIARLSPIVRKSRVGQRQGLVHQHVPFNFCAPTILAEDALCRF